MAKKKKTLKQKMLADLRQQKQSLPIVSTDSGKIVLSQSSHTTHVTPVTTNIAFSYTHLKSDLTKTVIVTCAIVVVELVLHLLTNGV
jgi:hypothetical protein